MYSKISLVNKMFEGHVRSLKGGFQTYIESLTSFLFVNPISLVELSPGQF